MLVPHRQGPPGGFLCLNLKFLLFFYRFSFFSFLTPVLVISRNVEAGIETKGDCGMRRCLKNGKFIYWIIKKIFTIQIEAFGRCRLLHWLQIGCPDFVPAPANRRSAADRVDDHVFYTKFSGDNFCLKSIKTLNFLKNTENPQISFKNSEKIHKNIFWKKSIFPYH